MNRRNSAPASGRCDFLLQDKEGRLASEMAFLYGDDPAAARWLSSHERNHADAASENCAERITENKVDVILAGLMALFLCHQPIVRVIKFASLLT